MITNIYLASNEITFTPWWGHMQFVALTNSGQLLEMEVQMPFSGFLPLPFADWVVENALDRDHASNTPLYGVEGSYRIVELDVNAILGFGGERTPDEIWEIIHQASIGISNAWLSYALESNSNSFVNTVLNTVGIDLASYYSRLLLPEASGGFPGWQTDVANRLGGNVNFEVAGTSGDDWFQGGWGDDFIGGGEGIDRLGDGEGKDTLEGGAGDDTFVLANDNAADIIIVGRGNDIVQGGDEYDRIVIRVGAFEFDYRGYGAYVDEDGNPLFDEDTPSPAGRLGNDGPTRAIALLGGFVGFDLETGENTNDAGYFDHPMTWPIGETLPHFGWDALTYQAGSGPDDLIELVEALRQVLPQP